MNVMRAMAFIAGVLLIGCAGKQAPHARLVVPDTGWTPIFNGKDLDGWTPKFVGRPAGENYLNTFRAEDGLLKVSYADYDRFNGMFGSLFYTREKLSRYRLRVEYRFTGSKVRGAPGWTWRNSGLQLHSQNPSSMEAGQTFPVSAEFDLVGGHFMGSRPTGDVCRNGVLITIDGKPLADYCSKISDITLRGDDWITVLAEVDGAAHIRQAVNGQVVVEYSDIVLDTGNHDSQHLLATGNQQSLESGYISIQANGAPVEFRRIEIQPLE